MEETEDYHAKWNKPVPKIERPNVLSDMWMLTHNKEQGRIEVNWVRQRGMKGREGSGNKKVSRMN